MPVEFLPLLLAFTVLTVPGIAMSFALLRGTSLNRADKALLGAVLGFVAVPLLSFVEYLFLGIGFSAQLVLANSLLVLLASLFAMHLQGAKIKKPSLGVDLSGGALDVLKRHKKPAIYLALLAIMALTFYVRFAPAFDATFFEFDPYYYEKLTERLVTAGHIDAFSGDAYYPEKAFQAWPPLTQYLTGSWYLLHQFFAGQSYDKTTLILVSQLYPPVVAAFMGFVAFLLVRTEYNAYYGLVAAGLMAFTPQLVKKFGAGVAETQPWALFAAVLLFALVLLMLKEKSYRLGALAGIAALSNLLGSQQYIWPIIVLGVFIGIQGVLYFLSNSFDAKKWQLLGLVTAGVLLGNTILALYQGQYIITFTDPIPMTLLAAYVFGTILFAAAKFLPLKTMTHRVGALGAITVLGIVASSFTPLLNILANTVLSQSRAAFARGALGQTIAEEGRTVPSLFEPSFGSLNPPLLLGLAALVTLLLAVVWLARRDHVKSAGVLAVFGFSLIFLNPVVDSGLSALEKAIQNPDVSGLINLFIQNDVFGYLLIALVSVSALYLTLPENQRSETTLLMALIVFPIAFVGLNKLKFIVHLSVGLTLALPYVLGESQRLLEALNEWFKVFANPASFRIGVLAFLLAIGAFGVFAQSQTVGQSMTELQFTRIPSDWVQAYQWMNANTPVDSRIMSWWDYGHWTNFFGDRDSVLAPTNLYGKFNHGVARAFVNGDVDELYDRMDFHQATHVLVDADLVGKWGALVYLSGTCQQSDVAFCPKAPDVNLSNSPGQSKYETEHYFETLAVVGNCPASLTGVPVPAMQSSFGLVYCVTQNELLLVTNDGQLSGTARSYKLVGRDNITQLSENESYLFAIGENQFINVNPDLEPFNMKSNVFNAAFTRLYFFESLPGFELAYRSPNSQVKIFKYTGRP
ncbi:hypothetical protein HY572_06685 [Candidatus Micrarchaeota archaeon]|nr:hypothetical protein [Candidatus Micrarchaeota archaeon]